MRTEWQAPVNADTIGGTTGISQPPNAVRRSMDRGRKCRYGTTVAVTRPAIVPVNHSTQSMSTATHSERVLAEQQAGRPDGE